MPCLFALIAVASPRIGSLLIWIARPERFEQAFGGSWLWPILGIIFVPFTTLLYVIMWAPGVGLSSWDVLWLIMAVFIDISHWTSTAYSNRERIPGMSSSPSGV